MLQISVKSTLDKLRASLSAFDDDQLPYTVAKALTATAKDAQEAVQAAMPSEFILRRNWIVQGIRVDPARKNNLVATVYSKDPFMGRQEYGGQKIPMDGGRHIAIPLAARPNDANIIPSRLLPDNLGRAVYTISRNGNVVPMKGTGGTAFKMMANGVTYLALRTGAGKAGLAMMYLLLPSTTVKPRLNLGEITLKTVGQRFAMNFFAAARDAMATRRAGGTLSDG